MKKMITGKTNHYDQMVDDILNQMVCASFRDFEGKVMKFSLIQNFEIKPQNLR